MSVHESVKTVNIVLKNDQASQKLAIIYNK